MYSQAKFTLKPSSQKPSNTERMLDGEEIFVTENGKYYFDGTKLNAYQSNNGTFFNFTQEYFYYIGHRGNNSEFDFRASGAYIFRPESQDPIRLNSPKMVKIQEGEFYIQLEMEFEDFVSQIIRIPMKKSLANLEVEWIIGPIPIGHVSHPLS